MVDQAIIPFIQPPTATLTPVGNAVALLLETFKGELTIAQQRYLMARAGTSSHAAACELAGNSAHTREAIWLSSSTPSSKAFKEAERQIVALSLDAKVQLARAVYQQAMPLVAHRQVAQAVEDHKGLSDRSLMAQQRARDAVTKGAGMGEGGSEGEERLDLLAIRLWRKKGST